MSLLRIVQTSEKMIQLNKIIAEYCEAVADIRKHKMNDFAW